MNHGRRVTLDTGMDARLGDGCVDERDDSNESENECAGRRSRNREESVTNVCVGVLISRARKRGHEGACECVICD